MLLPLEGRDAYVDAVGWFAPTVLPQPLSADVPRLIAAARAVLEHPELAFAPQ